MLTFALTLFGIVLIGFPLALLVIAIKEHREIKTATLKRPRRPTRVNVSNEIVEDLRFRALRVISQNITFGY